MGTLLMNQKKQISLASVILAGLFATGCSQQQIQEPVVTIPTPEKPAPIVVKPTPVIPAPVVTPPPVRPTPRPRNPNCHTHPANSMTKSIQHCHKNPTGKHHYGNRVTKKHTPETKPQVDVYALQRKLKAKGYYKGAIDGVVGSETRGALKRFQNR